MWEFICLPSQQGKMSQAIAVLQKATVIDPEFVEPHTSLAVVLNEQGRYNEAQLHYQNAVKLRPADANAHNNLGVFQANRGRHILTKSIVYGH